MNRDSSDNAGPGWAVGERATDRENSSELAWGDTAGSGARIGPYELVDGSYVGGVGDGAYFRSGGGYQKEVYQGREFDLWKFRGHTNVRPTSDTGLELGWRIGTQPHYDAEDLADLYRGFSWRGSLALNQNLLDRLDLEYRIIGERFSREPTSPTIYNTTLHRFRANMNFTRELSTRLITDYSNAEETVSSSALFAWQRNYGTAAYLGGSGVWSVGEPQPGEVSIFAKLSWLWRP